MRFASRALYLALGSVLLLGVASGVRAQEVGRPTVGERGITETVDQIMIRQWNTYPGEIGNVIRDMEGRMYRPERELEREKRQNPKAPKISKYPVQAQLQGTDGVLVRGGQPYAVGTSFLGGTLAESLAAPPDTMGDVGPTQILMALNGRIKVFDRSGVVGPLNADLDVFFNSVRNGTTTSDPRVKFDRLTNRWYVICINTVGSNNRVLLAVSSGPTITGSGSFTFFFFQHDAVGSQPNPDNGDFFDYPSLGVDANALYIGGNLFNSGFSTTLHVVRKSSVTGGGPIVVTPFRNIGSGAAAGPYSPLGVDNDDPAATQGFVIGVDTLTFGTLMLRRISDPGGTPSISGNVAITVPATTFPQSTPCLGTAGSLDALDDRLFQAKIFFNKLTNTRTLWTAHNIEVNASGVASTTGNRNGSRWYEISNLGGAPTLVQSGTIFSNAGANPANFTIPSLAMNLQGHAMFGSSMCGAAQRAEIAAAGRFSSDALGTMQPPTVVQTSATNYNVFGGVERWGDYSASVVDPNDGMSVWTFQEYCNTTNSWGVRIIQLLAPPPATIQSVSQTNLTQGTTVNVNVTGTSTAGSGFFEPGAGYPNHIAATVSGSGVIVNSVTFNSPTSLTLNITTQSGAALGARNLTIINPDGQQTTMNNAFVVVSATAVIIDPDSYTVLIGSEASHNLAAFLLSDDVRHQINTSAIFTSQVEFHGVSPFITATRLSYILESSTNWNNRRRIIQLFNYDTSVWETVSTTFSALTDTTVQVDITTNPSRFIHDTTGEVLARVGSDFPTAARTLARSIELYDRAVREVLP